MLPRCLPPLLLLPVFAGCAEDRALLRVPVHLSPSVDLDVTLSAATLTLSSMRMEAPAQAASRSFFPVAHAHPGHDLAGAVAGELVGTWTVDLLGGDVLLGDADCYEGAYATARVTLLPEPPALLEGTATVDGAARPFSFALAPDQEVTGLPFVATLDADAPPSGLTLSVDLAHALSFVDWSTPDEDGDGVLTVADGDLGNTALFGVVSSPTFALSLED